jgi:uncharacterized protein
VIVCWDASAVVKLVREEPGRDVAAALWEGDLAAVASTLVRPEAASALARSGRDGSLDPAAYDAAVASVARILDGIDLLSLDDDRARRAAALVASSQLRGADAVHLATALDIADLGAEVVLATWDRRLHEAALHAGIGVAPGEL